MVKVVHSVVMIGVFLVFVAATGCSHGHSVRKIASEGERPSSRAYDVVISGSIKMIAAQDFQLRGTFDLESSGKSEGRISGFQYEIFLKPSSMYKGSYVIKSPRSGIGWAGYHGQVRLNFDTNPAFEIRDGARGTIFEQWIGKRANLVLMPICKDESLNDCEAGLLSGFHDSSTWTGNNLNAEFRIENATIAFTPRE